MKKRYIISFVVAIIILSVLFLWNVGAGSVDISTSDLFAILAGSGKDETFSQIVWKIRMPAHQKTLWPAVLSRTKRQKALSIRVFQAGAFHSWSARS